MVLSVCNVTIRCIISSKRICVSQKTTCECAWMDVQHQVTRDSCFFITRIIFHMCVLKYTGSTRLNRRERKKIATLWILSSISIRPEWRNARNAMEMMHNATQNAFILMIWRYMVTESVCYSGFELTRVPGKK